MRGADTRVDGRLLPQATDGELWDRYPGPLQFQDTEHSKRAFWGRERETEELLHRVRANRMLVLFGKSGLGKTSLLQAGLFPRLRDHGLLPIPIRLNDPDRAPFGTIIAAIRSACEIRGIDLVEGSDADLRQFCATSDFWDGDLLLTPVLVFDQFEEIFTLQKDSARRLLATELGKLADRVVSARAPKRGGKEEPTRRGDVSPNVRVILSLREEYVGALEELTVDIQAIFEQRFQLEPLDGKRAIEAIVKPAGQVDPEVFKSEPFTYREKALKEMIEVLTDARGAVEPFQLQIICLHAEREMAKCRKGDSRAFEVNSAMLGGRQRLEALLRDFYFRSLETVPGWLQRRRIRRFFDEELLSNGHRVSVEEGRFKGKYRLSDESLRELIQARLVRRESRPGLPGYYYEITHDSLAQAISQNPAFRVPYKAVAALVIVMVGTGLFSFLQNLEREAAEALAEMEIERANAEKIRANEEEKRANAEKALAAAAKRREALQRELKILAERDANHQKRRADDLEKITEQTSLSERQKAIITQLTNRYEQERIARKNQVFRMKDFAEKTKNLERELEFVIARLSSIDISEVPAALTLGVGAPVNSIAFSPDGRRLVVGSDSGRVTVWDTELGKLLRSWEGDPADEIVSVAYSRDGKLIASGFRSGSVHVWSTASKMVNSLYSWDHDSRTPVSSVAFSADGKQYASSSGATALVGKFDRFQRNFASPNGPINSLAFSPRGPYLAAGVGVKSGSVEIWDLQTGGMFLRLRHSDFGHGVNAVAYSMGGLRIASGANDQAVHIWDAVSGKLVRKLKHRDVVRSIAYSQDGRILASGLDDGSVYLWGAHKGKRLYRYRKHKDKVTTVAISLDGLWLASGSRDGTVRRLRIAPLKKK